MVAVGALLVSWLLLDESSPLDQYFLWHVEVPNFWRLLNAVPFIAGSMISGSHAGPDFPVFIALLLIQWFIVGFVISFVLSMLWRRP